ncbi:hypothetical protein RUM44_007645 [Polyplax serrata]|uniref:Uncharacterized protein n=1 Tax=Polyplax serrata TaxID=468196 RepID=A0ABR1B712_POLSC
MDTRGRYLGAPRQKGTKNKQTDRKRIFHEGAINKAVVVEEFEAKGVDRPKGSQEEQEKMKEETVDVKREDAFFDEPLPWIEDAEDAKLCTEKRSPYF